MESGEKIIAGSGSRSWTRVVGTCIVAAGLASALALTGCSSQNASSTATTTSANTSAVSQTATSQTTTSQTATSQTATSQTTTAQTSAAQTATSQSGSTVFPADQETVTPTELDDAIKAQQKSDDIAFLEVIDVRKTVDYINQHVPDSLSTPLRQIKQGLRLNQITTSGTVVIVATDNDEAQEAKQALIDNGYDSSKLKILDGGWQAWADAGLKVDNGEKIGC